MEFIHLIRSRFFKKFTFKIFLLIFCTLVSFILVNRYMLIEPDVANSPLVWREFTHSGFKAFSDWYPTPDNWYFTAYPIHFLLFFLTGSDGVITLKIATSLFISISAFLCACFVGKLAGKASAFMTALSLTAMNAFIYTYGFAAHPFSHYSTVFFGLIFVLLCLKSISGRSPFYTIFASVLGVLSSASDPWFAPTFFLPAVITYFALTLRDRVLAKGLLALSLGFALAITQALPAFLNLPEQHFSLIEIELWTRNLYWAVTLTARSLNILVFNDAYLSLLSIILTLTLFLFSLLRMPDSKEVKFFCIFSLLSVMGIFSSFTVSYANPEDISARFFLNVTVLVITTVFASRLSVVVKSTFCFLLIVSSLFSYHKTSKPMPEFDQTDQTYALINFLEKNNLTFGYAGYFNYSNSVNWLSKGKIHISTILYDENKGIGVFSIPRMQTMRSWLTEGFALNSPERQFVMVPAIRRPNIEKPDNARLDHIQSQIGQPAETLYFNGIKIIVYNHRIDLSKLP